MSVGTVRAGLRLLGVWGVNAPVRVLRSYEMPLRFKEMRRREEVRLGFADRPLFDGARKAPPRDHLSFAANPHWFNEARGGVPKDWAVAPSLPDRDGVANASAAS